MTTDEITTQPEPEHIARAGELLDAVLAGRPVLETRLTVGEVLNELYDVTPPYPPHPEPEAPIDADTGIRQALVHLAQAAQQPSSIEEGLRVGSAIRKLRRLADESQAAQP